MAQRAAETGAQGEHGSHGGHGGHGLAALKQALRNPRVYLFAFIYFALTCG